MQPSSFGRNSTTTLSPFSPTTHAQMSIPVLPANDPSPGTKGTIYARTAVKPPDLNSSQTGHWLLILADSNHNPILHELEHKWLIYPANNAWWYVSFMLGHNTSTLLLDWDDMAHQDFIVMPNYSPTPSNPCSDCDRPIPWHERHYLCQDCR